MLDLFYEGGVLFMSIISFFLLMTLVSFYLHNEKLKTYGNLALASGITVDNAKKYSEVDCFMVATGINYDDNFYEIDPMKLSKLLNVCRQIGKGE